MNKLLLSLVAGTLVACAAPHRLVYSNGFSFGNYDYLIVAKPESATANSSLYGVDVEFANLMASYNLKVIGDKELAGMTAAAQQRTLIARVGVSSGEEVIVMSVAFDDVVSGRTQASMSSREKGDIFDEDDREDAFEALTKTLVKALVQDKSLAVTKDRGLFSSAPKPGPAVPVASTPAPSAEPLVVDRPRLPIPQNRSAPEAAP
ncbi:MAG: hypothetical protein ACT4PZ_10310 [Panacagrimonas sp.]